MEPERWRRFQSRLLPVHVNGVGLSDVGIPIECRRFRGGKNAALLITTLDLQRYTLYASIYIYIYIDAPFFGLLRPCRVKRALRCTLSNESRWIYRMDGMFFGPNVWWIPRKVHFFLPSFFFFFWKLEVNLFIQRRIHDAFMSQIGRIFCVERSSGIVSSKWR